MREIALGEASKDLAEFGWVVLDDLWLALKLMERVEQPTQLRLGCGTAGRWYYVVELAPEPARPLWLRPKGGERR